ncbi:hypothetical protein M9458_040351, partial [Cirrhinus mrigala]
GTMSVPSKKADKTKHLDKLDLAEGMETGDPLSPASPARSAARSQGSEARSAVSSPRGTGSTLHLSSSEEVDVETVDEVSAPQFPQYEELLEVVTRAVAKLNIDWPAEPQVEPQKSKLDERFLRSWPPSARRSLPFFPDLHTEVSRSWNEPFSSRLFIPASYNYGCVAGLHERGYRAMPRVEQTLASYLSPESASSLKAPVLPSKPLRVTSALVGKGYTAAGQAGACLHTISVLQAYQADLLKELDEGDEVRDSDISELRRTADLSLRATKETARAIGRSMEEAIEVVPPHDRESGFYSRSEDWFVTIDPKDAYFHVSILPQHRKGKAYQYRVLPFGLALSPRTFTKCVDAALASLRLQGIRILNYIDDWLILAQSEMVAVRHRDVVLAHMKELGLRLNAKKSVLSPLQRTTYLGVVWDSTTMQARLSPARIEKLYALKWKLFTSWCGRHQQDPVNCPVGSVLEFLQDRLSAGLTHSTLKVYVVAIAAYDAPLGGLSVGKNPRLRPPVRPCVPSWDLSVVLEALCLPPFEPIEEISDRHLSIKTVLLLALSSLKRVGDLQALSVAPSFLDFAPGLSKAFLYPRAGYIPKVPSSAPRPVVLQAFCPPPFWDPDQQKLNCMCPVRALDTYVHRAAGWRKSDQLFVCYGPPKKGFPASKQTLSRWIVDAISLSYASSGLPPPLGVRAHSTRSMAASKAFLAGVSIQDICIAAGWSTPLTFVRFYELDLRAVPGSS